MATRSADEPVLVRVSFKDGISSEAILKLVAEYPFQTLSGSPQATIEQTGLRLLFRREDDGGLQLDGGLLFEAVVEEDGRGTFLDISRLNDGRGDAMPPVIREKQVCKKVVAKLEENQYFSYARNRPYGSGSF